MKNYDSKEDNTVFYVVLVGENKYSTVNKFHKLSKKDKIYRDAANDKEKNLIKAWTDNKELLKFYLDFHKCKDFKTVVIEATVADVYDIVESNLNDEIQIQNLLIRDPKKPYKEKYLQVPITNEEKDALISEIDYWGSGRINYNLISQYYGIIKNKYRKVFDNILLTDILHSVNSGKKSKFLNKIKLDQLVLLYRTFPGCFD